MQLGDGGSGQQRRRRRSMRLFFPLVRDLTYLFFQWKRKTLFHSGYCESISFPELRALTFPGSFPGGLFLALFWIPPLTPFNRSEWNSHRWIDGGSSSCLCRDSVSLFSIGLIERYHNKTKQNINIIDLANVFIRFLFLIPRLSSGLI
jgi:hypothetical protein